ncbi:hypothetical protein M885DRAFT_568659 [Pelagophyceae sp. CCMP2097]|nr:hypothetical protein M885DRAFT_568659 [Pelagophyceae sp. CCMP2097]
MAKDLVELKGVLDKEAEAARTVQNHNSTLPSSHPLPSLRQLADENDVLALFAIFVVFHPKRIGEEMNQASTVEG